MGEIFRYVGSSYYQHNEFPAELFVNELPSYSFFCSILVGSINILDIA